MRTLAPELAKLFGRRIDMSAKTAEQAVIIGVNGVPAKTLIEKLGVALRCEVRITPEAIDFIPKDSNLDTTAAFKKRLEKIKALQDKVRASLAKEKPFDQAQASALAQEVEEFFKRIDQMPPNRYDPETEKIGKDGPHSRLANRIFVELDPNQLAAVTKRNRLVYSSHPTRMQVPLPKSSYGPIQDFLKEQAIWQRTIEGKTFKYPENRGLPSNIYRLIQGNFDWDAPPEAQPDPKNVKQILVSVRSWGETMSQIEVKLVGETGKYATEVQLSTHEIERATDGKSNPETKSVENPEKFRIVLNPVQMEIAEIFGQQMMGGEPQDEKPKLSKGALDIILNPETNDPVSWLLGPSLLQFAESQKKQIVAAPILFSAFFVPLSEDRKSVNLAMLHQYATAIPGAFPIIEDSTFIVLTRPDFSKIRDEFTEYDVSIDRAALGQLLRTAWQEGRVSLDLISSYFAKVIKPEDSEGYFAQLGVHLANTLCGERANYWDMATLRLYGSLDAMQRKLLLSGKEIPFGGLKPDQQQIFREAVYGGENYNMQFNPGESMTQDAWELFYNGIFGEMTFRFPNGIPRDAAFGMTVNSGPKVRVKAEYEWGPHSEVMDVESIGYHLASLENPDNEGYQPPKYTEFAMVDQTTYVMTLKLDKQVSVMRQLSDTKAAGKGVNDPAQLPKEVWEKIQDAKKRATQGREGPVPPPPSVGTATVPPIAVRLG